MQQQAGGFQKASEFQKAAFICGDLEDGPVEEQSEQLNEIEEDVAVLLLHPDDVGQSEGPVGVDASIGRGGPGEEAKLEKVLHHHRQLRDTEGKYWVSD